MRSGADDETRCDAVSTEEIGALFEELVFDLPSYDELLDDDEEVQLVVPLREESGEGTFLNVTFLSRLLSDGREKLIRLLPSLDDDEDCLFLVCVGANTDDGVDPLDLGPLGGEKFTVLGLEVLASCCIARLREEARRDLATAASEEARRDRATAASPRASLESALRKPLGALRLDFNICIFRGNTIK